MFKHIYLSPNPTSHSIRPQRKSLVSLLTIFALLLGAGVMIQSALAQQKKLIAIVDSVAGESVL